MFHLFETPYDCFERTKSRFCFIKMLVLQFGLDIVKSSKNEFDKLGSVIKHKRLERANQNPIINLQPTITTVMIHVRFFIKLLKEYMHRVHTIDWYVYAFLAKNTMRQRNLISKWERANRVLRVLWWTDIFAHFKNPSAHYKLYTDDETCDWQVACKPSGKQVDRFITTVGYLQRLLSRELKG